MISGLCHSSLALLFFFNPTSSTTKSSPVLYPTIDLHFIDQAPTPSNSFKQNTKNKVNAEIKSKPVAPEQPLKNNLDHHKASSAPPISTSLSTLGSSHTNNPPQYPISARKENIEGTVHLKVVISEKGRVSNITVLPPKTAAILEQAALETVRKWSFNPSPLGTAVEVYIPIHFKLED